METNDSTLLRQRGTCEGNEYLLTNDLIYAQEEQSAIYIFKRNGSLIRKIDHRGGGPGAVSYTHLKTIPYNEDRVYAMLSDLSNLERVKDRIPQDKIKDFEFDSDSCSFAVDPVGKITFQIVEREPNKTIKFTTTNAPVPLFLWIQLKQVEEADTRVKMTIRADLNPFIKPMVSKPLQDALDKISTVIASLPY